MVAEEINWLEVRKSFNGTIKIMLFDYVMNRVSKVCIFVNSFKNIHLNITLQYSRLFEYHVL